MCADKSDFISEDDLKSFEGWLRYQGVDAATAQPDEIAMWRDCFDEAQKQALTTPKVGLMKLKTVPGQYRYAVAIRDGSDLWLALWIRRSPRGEVFILIPRAKGHWDPHASYHADGTFHHKSYGKTRVAQKRQPLTDNFTGTEHLGMYAGHMPKDVGAVCDPADFDGIVEAGPRVLGPIHGCVIVDLVEPEKEPIPMPDVEVVREEVFRDFEPWLVIRICSMARDNGEA
jgi:hypothetical protein